MVCGNRSQAAPSDGRKATALGGFWIAFIMLVAALASWWAGVIGGNHRDDGI